MEALGNQNVMLKNATSPIDIPRIRIENFPNDGDVSMVEADDAYENSSIVMENMPVGSSGDEIYDSPKLPRPSSDFKNVMVKYLHAKVRDVPHGSLPMHSNLGSNPNRNCVNNTSNFVAHSVPSALSPSNGRRRPRRNVRFDETTITVTAEMGESAARFRSRWRQRHGLASSPPIKFGTKNIVVQHNESAIQGDRIEDIDLSPSGKSVFDVCSYSPYGRYT